MKFNERNVSYFASCNSPVDKTGFLLKKADNHRNFQKRWFVLKGNLLFYYDKEGDKEPQGVIILESCRVELADLEDCLYCFQISFSVKDSRTYVMAATSQEEMESWMKVLSCSSYDYIKAMVDELQKQLDELTHGNSENSPMMLVRSSVIQTGEAPEAEGATGGAAAGGAAALQEHPMELPPKTHMGTYERGKTESLAHKGAPRQSAYQANTLTLNNYSNPSYDIWDPLVPSGNSDEGQGDSSNGAARTIPHTLLERESSESEEEEEKPHDSSNNSNKNVNAHTDYKQDQTDSLSTSRLLSAGRRVKSVFYENINLALPLSGSASTDTSPRLARRAMHNRAFHRGAHNAQGGKSAQTGQSIFHVHDEGVRSFADMHEEFGMLIVKKMNLFRQRKTASKQQAT
ncbi:uncharacterized protein [Diadema antillarum]|uniref:uncharacterized protein n=1 Tax=Diadema antillarum TaxID=105358 RepID=UPI003A88CD25